ncbi:hypothetical protein [Gordonia sp. (in: high G+C Gram-positive bacteria)]|uniref:hypothetical protein n=1 Tax=Gordonia TaxID=2053 RepID=UPI003C791868
MIVDDPGDPGAYDTEWIIVLDDWTSGVGPSPDEILAGLRSPMTGGTGGGHMGGGMGGSHMGGGHRTGAHGRRDGDEPESPAQRRRR